MWLPKDATFTRMKSHQIVMLCSPYVLESCDVTMSLATAANIYQAADQHGRWPTSLPCLEHSRKLSSRARSLFPDLPYSGQAGGSDFQAHVQLMRRACQFRASSGSVQSSAGVADAGSLLGDRSAFHATQSGNSTDCRAHESIAQLLNAAWPARWLLLNFRLRRD